MDQKFWTKILAKKFGQIFWILRMPKFLDKFFGQNFWILRMPNFLAKLFACQKFWPNISDAFKPNFLAKIFG
jgi:hypothetical protein